MSNKDNYNDKKSKDNHRAYYKQKSQREVNYHTRVDSSSHTRVSARPPSLAEKFINTSNILFFIEKLFKKVHAKPVQDKTNPGPDASAVSQILIDEHTSDKVVAHVFCEAAKHGQIHIMQSIWNEYPLDINTLVDQETRSTFLHAAAYFGHMEAVQFLMDKPGCDPTLKDKFGRTALDLALAGGISGDTITILADAERKAIFARLPTDMQKAWS